jgi:hypothetical protein
MTYSILALAYNKECNIISGSLQIYTKIVPHLINVIYYKYNLESIHINLTVYKV